MNDSQKILEQIVSHIDKFSSLSKESTYVIDILQNQFYYIKPDFQCGYITENETRKGFEFYSRIVYSEDLSLWKGIYNVVLPYLKSVDEKHDEIDCFSCTFRLQREYSFISNPLPQMVYHWMIPVWAEHKFRYLICSANSSTAKEAGNLCLYYKGSMENEEYNFKTKRWKHTKKEQLTEREKAILLLAAQGKSTKETAVILCSSHHTIRNQIKPIFSKFNVNSMQEAIEFANNNRMIL